MLFKGNKFLPIISELREGFSFKITYLERPLAIKIVVTQKKHEVNMSKDVNVAF